MWLSSLECWRPSYNLLSSSWWTHEGWVSFLEYSSLWRSSWHFGGGRWALDGMVHLDCLNGGFHSTRSSLGWGSDHVGVVVLEDHIVLEKCWSLGALGGGALDLAWGVLIPWSLACWQHHLGAWHVSFGVERFTCVDLLVRERLIIMV